MKTAFLISVFCFFTMLAGAQEKVSVSGKIENVDGSELIYLGIGGGLFPLKLSEEAMFSLEADVKNIPSNFYFASLSKSGKIERLSPLIWFEKDIIEVRFDWPSKRFFMQETVSFQTASENLESMEWEQQKEQILRNPNSILSLYFADGKKDKIDITDLEGLLQDSREDFGTSDYFKRIENFVAAKKLMGLGKGTKLEDFSLPDKEGNQVSVLGEAKKPRIISLFSSGCAYSIASISMLEEISNTSGDKIHLVTIWDDPTKQMWLDTHQDYKSKISWTNLWDEYGFASTYLNRTMWPTFFVVSEQGDLLEIVEGYSKKTERKLKEMVE
jgi:hypothetical protein